MPVNHAVKIWITGFETVHRWCLRTLWMIWYTHTHVKRSGWHTVAVCVCVWVWNKQAMWQQCPECSALWLCSRAVLSLSMVIMGDGREAEWGDKFRMRGSDEAFCRPPVGPQSCTASDGCIYCRPTSTAPPDNTHWQTLSPTLAHNTHEKRQKTPQWQLWDDTYAPSFLSFPASCFLFLTSNHLLSRSEYSVSSSSLLQMLFFVCFNKLFKG